VHLMSWIVPIASVLEILLLLYVATIDIATRLIRNEICLALALLGIAGQFSSPMQIAQSLIIAASPVWTIARLTEYIPATSTSACQGIDE